MSYKILEENVKKEFPKFKIISKEDSLFMKTISYLLFLFSFGKFDRETFMQLYVTTIGYTMYMPTGWQTRALETSKILNLIHEREHMRQLKKYGYFRMFFGYLFWIFPIGFADFRLKREIEANAVEIVYGHQEFGLPLWDVEFKKTIKVLSSSDYLWPTFKPEKVEKLLREEILKQMKVIK